MRFNPYSWKNDNFSLADFGPCTPALIPQTPLTSAVEDILQDPGVTLIPQSRETFLAGLSLFRTRADKSYSLTDCISMRTMQRLGLTAVLTNDRHFEQEGFRAIFRKKESKLFRCRSGCQRSPRLAATFGAYLIERFGFVRFLLSDLPKN